MNDLVALWMALGLACGAVARVGAAYLALPTIRSLGHGACPTCAGPVLRRATLLPLLGGRPPTDCPSCGAAASIPVPLAEGATAVAFGLLVGRFAGTALILYSVTTLVLALLFLSDVYYRLLPNRVLAPATALLAVAFALQRGPAPVLLGGAVGGGLFLAIYVAGEWLFPGRGALGMGDVKLAALVGVVVGLPAVMSAILLTALIGAGLAALWLIRRPARAHLPYGTALALGTLATLILDARV
ncbi:MAG: prepilin peptidase [Chloroflexi bacterium]|nr:prepilin peptidase [Chloroflexota bacterium]